MRSRSRPTWERVPPHNVFYYKVKRSPVCGCRLACNAWCRTGHGASRVGRKGVKEMIGGPSREPGCTLCHTPASRRGHLLQAAPTRKAYVMSFAVVFDQADDAYEFAYCFPYTFTRLQDHLRGADAAQHGHLQHHHLGRSLEGRPLDILSISAPRNFSDATRAPDLKVVFVSARVHPGETPASFVMQGLIDFLLGSCQAARRLREKTLFKIVPMLNPDGVWVPLWLPGVPWVRRSRDTASPLARAGQLASRRYHGTYRCSVNGHDLNRCWRWVSSARWT